MAAETIHPVTEATLHAFVDGQLAAGDIDAVSRWLRAHPQDALSVATWQAQRAQLQALHRDVLDEPVPIALVQSLKRALHPRRFAAWPQMAAAAALLGVGWLGGWAMHGDSPSTLVTSGVPEFVHEARVAHVVYTPEKRHAVEVGADQSKHLIEWLSRRLGAPLAAPDLSALGYTLMGGRLLPGERAQSRAQFMYEQASGERVTLHVSVFDADATPASTSFRFATDEASSSFYWVDGRYGYALTGKLPRALLEALANVAYKQLLPATPSVSGVPAP
jgi:anti-sigma factor RsiW